MILIDVGNTNLNFAWERNGQFIKTKRIETDKANKKNIEEVFSKYPKEKILICSVVPSVTKIFKSLKQKVYIAGEDIKIPIRCFYNKKEVGMDRLVCAFAASKIFHRARLIIDFGTAITFDFLSKKGDYQGGLILPGIGSTLKVLSRCALLPKKIELKKTKEFSSKVSRLKVEIPKDTKRSIAKGVEEGFSSMVNSLVEKYKRILHLRPKETIIITGGEASFVAAQLNFSCIYEPLLVLRGLLILGNEISS